MRSSPPAAPLAFALPQEGRSPHSLLHPDEAEWGYMCLLPPPAGLECLGNTSTWRHRVLYLDLPPSPPNLLPLLFSWIIKKVLPPISHPGSQPRSLCPPHPQLISFRPVDSPFGCFLAHSQFHPLVISPHRPSPSIAIPLTGTPASWPSPHLVELSLIKTESLPLFPLSSSESLALENRLPHSSQFCLASLATLPVPLSKSNTANP